MNLEELIERLTELRDELGVNAEVRLMTQEAWPFENYILGVTCTSEMNEFASDEEDEDEVDEDANVVYLVEGGQLCYGSKLAWEAVRGG